MPSKSDIAIFGRLLGEMVERAIDFKPSVQTCNEFASRIFAEAHQAGEPIIVMTVRGTDGQAG